MAKKTVRSEMKGFVGKTSPTPGSKLVGYSYQATDGFIQNILTQRLLQDEITLIKQGRLIDGSSNTNDDFYRRTGLQAQRDPTTGATERRQKLSLARQLSTKTDQEAVIRLVARAKKKVKADSSKQNKSVAPLVNIVPPYTKFFLESVTEDRMEKAQVVETFGEFIAFFFGRRPEIYQFGGRLLNTKNHDWKNDFQEMYDNFLRGTKAVENNATVFIQYDDVIAEGFIMGCHLEYHGVTNNECPFNFTMLIINRAPINQLQRLRERRARSRFSAAEQQLLNDLTGLRKSNPVPFTIMQKALSSGGLDTSDIVLYTQSKNKLKPSNPVSSPPTTSESELDDLLKDI
jgi:hypothetical protein